MARYTVIPENAFDGLQVDAGVLLKDFNIEQAAAGKLGFTDADIICATTGGINPTCVPTYSDYAEDVDNAPTNLKEFKHLDGWECKIATTSLGNSPELIRLSLGAADIDITNTGKIVPRRNLSQDDFSDIWWVGDRADGGFVAIQLLNALSSGGFSLQTTKNGKGQVTLEITGHVSIEAQNVVPMVFYSIDPFELQHVTVAPEAQATEVFEVPVSSLQKSDVAVNGNEITGTLEYMNEDNAITQVWGYGNFLVLKFTNLDPTATSVKVGLQPSQGSGLAEIISDPDKNCVAKITDKNRQKFVVISSDGTTETKQTFSLKGLTLTAGG